MRTFYCLGILICCLLAPSIAAADDSGWYVGFDLGRTTASTNPGGLWLADSLEGGPSVPYGDPALVTTNSSSLSSTSIKVEGGDWFNSYVGFQVGYLDMGTYSDGVHYHDPHNNICYGCGSPSENTTDFSDSSKIRVRGVAVALTGRLPLPDEFELLVRLGVYSGSSTYDESVTGLPNVGAGGSSSMDYSATDLGAGLGWRFSSHWGVQLWWDKYRHTGYQEVDISNAGVFNPFDVKGYSLAVQYHF